MSQKVTHYAIPLEMIKFWKWRKRTGGCQGLGLGWVGGVGGVLTVVVGAGTYTGDQIKQCNACERTHVQLNRGTRGLKSAGWIVCLSVPRPS